MLAAGCGFTESPDEAKSNDTGSTVPNYGPIAKESTDKAMKGINRPPESKSRPAVKGKTVGIVETADYVISVGFPAKAAKAAAEQLGWTVKMFDANNNPLDYPNRVQDAVTAGVDAIILVSIDCQKVKPQLQAAKAKNIKITSIYGYDCNDPAAGNEPDALFDAFTNYGPAAANIDEFTKRYGADQANYIISKSGNQPCKIIGITSDEYTVLKLTWDGFTEAIEKSGTCTIADPVVKVTTADVANAQTGMNPKIQGALQNNPDATWIKSPFTYVTTLGIGPVLNANPQDIKVMGGEGYKEELDLMKQDKPVVTSLNVIPSEWTGWAAIDTLNSVFRNEKPADSGLGWQIVDNTNVPKTDQYAPPVDFKAIYKKAWGV